MSAGDQPTEEELDEEFNNLSESEQEEIMSQYETENWDDLSYEFKLDALDYEAPEEGEGEDGEDDGEDDQQDEEQQEEDDTGSTPDVEVSSLLVQDELELVGNADASVTVAGVDIPGATEITMGAEGKESQYLRETQEGGEDGGNETFSNAPDDIGGGSDSGSNSGPRMGGSPSGGDQPPLHIEITGRMGQQRSEEFVSLRDEDTVFEVTIGDETFSDMELHDFTRELTGDQPYSHAITLEVVEWREVEMEEVDLSGYFGEGDSEDSGESSTEPEEAASDFQSGSPGEPETYNLEGGEQRNFNVGDGETARNAIIDTTAEGAGGTFYADGEDWTVREIGWRAEDNRSGIVARGSGSINTIFLGHGGDSGIVGEVLSQVEISNVNLQDSSNGIRLTDETADGLSSG